MSPTGFIPQRTNTLCVNYRPPPGTLKAGIAGNRASCSEKDIVILDGFSGVGLETSKHVLDRGLHPCAFSRSTERDFSKISDCRTAVSQVHSGLALRIRAGGSYYACEQEIIPSRNIAIAAQNVDIRIVVAVVRNVVFYQSSLRFFVCTVNCMSSPAAWSQGQQPSSARAGAFFF